MPATLADLLQDVRQRLDILPGLEQRLDALSIKVDNLGTAVEVGQAQTANALIRLRNRFIFPAELTAVQKTVCFM